MAAQSANSIVDQTSKLLETYFDKDQTSTRRDTLMSALSNINLRLLRVFVTMAERGGYSAAQSELNIGLSTISSHMTALEERLGVRLCGRGRGGFRLTNSPW